MPWGDGLPEFGDFPAGAWGDGLPLGPVEAPPGAAPQIVSALMLDCTTVKVTYDSEVNHANPANADDALNPANYSIVGATVLSVDSVSLSQASPTIVELAVSGNVQYLGAYTVTVSDVESIVGVVIDPAHNSASFLGVKCQAQNWIAEILIGNTVIWSAVNDFPQQTLEFDVSGYTGKHDIKFRIRGLE